MGKGFLNNVKSKMKEQVHIQEPENREIGTEVDVKV